MRQRRELHAVTTGRQAMELLTAIAAAIHPYVTAIHVREKHLSAAALQALAERLLAAGVPGERLYLNGRLQVARDMGLGGVQLPGDWPKLERAGQTDAGSLRIGVSVHSVKEALEREREGADYVLYGHIYATDSKLGLPPRGLEGLRELTLRTRVPVVAIGGITPLNAAAVCAAGAAGVAVMSGIWEADDPVQAAETYALALQGTGGRG
ncbi:thiamine phosphate synthase [Paenibacillus athensensis]|uniref:Thiamine phosphate synthase/TenI domain-containing protein n=1 Tax=Paenibacillus athensensis TaxID=1967502 RepID=A0A4Y8PPT4_9BACL|nr:thiamine phosphate synthase [Paenibacillus athensensis]MCD1260523.1 thiamine phosphate synthase [Paenibacillus athensensis]